MNTEPDPPVALPAEGVADAGINSAGTRVARPNAEQRTALREALEDLAEIDEEADELGLPPASPVAKQSARTFLRQAARKAPCCYAISPWDKGAVVVYAQNQQGSRVDIFFDANGSASCYVNHPRHQSDEEHHYTQAKQMANEWIFAILRNLEK